MAGIEQKNVVSNTAIGCVFFEDQNLCYNYKTNRWTQITDFAGQGYFSINDQTGIIGQIVFSETSVDLQTSTGGVASDALIITGELDPNEEGRFVTSGIRPLVNESTSTSAKMRVGVRDSISATVNFSSTSTPSTITGVIPFREEGRYHRAELELEGGFDTALGLDIQGYVQGTR